MTINLVLLFLCLPGVSKVKIHLAEKAVTLNFAASFKKIIMHGQIRAENSQNMKKELHPANYRFVVFKDMSNGYSFLTRSTAPSKETVKWEDGNEYPLIKLEISSTSHPFFTGQNILVDTAGRIDKFKKKYAKKS